MNTPPRFRPARRAAGAAGALACLLAGCIVPAQNPYPAPPQARVEARPLPPVSAEALAWQPGHWNWSGGAFVWEPGQYVPARGHGLNWMPGFWQQTPAGWAWQPAHWI